MNPERKAAGHNSLLKKSFKASAAALFVTGVVYFPLSNLGNSERIIGAVFGKPVECASGVKPQNPNYPFDAIVVPGAGNVKNPDGEYGPNSDEKMRLEAAAIAYYYKHDAPLVVLLNGVDINGENSSTGVKYLQDEYSEISGSTQEIPVVVEDKDINTATSMEQLEKIDTEYLLKKDLIETNEYHDTRATLSACVNGVAAESISAEKLLIGYDPQMKRSIEEKGRVRAKIAERLKIALSFWDVNERLLTRLQEEFIRQ